VNRRLPRRVARTVTLLIRMTACMACLWPLSRSWAAEDILIADFEGETYGDWIVTGEAFGSGPARGTLPGQMPVEGFEGRGLVNSFYQGDKTTGTLTSPKFIVQRKYLRFLIGGGNHPGETCINLLVGGHVVRTASGPNDRPGGSERLDWMQWDVAEWLGKEVTLEIVDRHTGGWGHINIDHILQTDQPLPEPRRNVVHDLEKPRRFLHLPVKNGAAQRRVRLEAAGQTVREFDIELADDRPDFFVFLDLQPLSGKPLRLVIDQLPAMSQALERITTANELPDQARLYREALRPQFHFSSRRGWLNDPNGLVFHAGEYHLFYQHNPYGWNWGNMHWGHAVSRDLVHWQELPIALYPRAYGDWAFSGSAVVDRDNTSGFKTGADDVLVLAYTSTGRGECIAYSNDRGRSWTEYEGNPVVKHRGRDPRLLWHAATRRWVMAVYDEPEVDGRVLQTIAFHSSPDLKQWTYQSRIEGFYECPDLFELPVDGRDDNRLWVLSAANGDYRLGHFDGREFQPQTAKLKGHFGNAFYAAQTFSNIPERDGRRIQIGWATVALPGMPFNQMMTFPTQLTLRTTAEGPRLHYAPVQEISALYRAESSLSGAATPLVQEVPELCDLEVTLQPQSAALVKLVVRGAHVVYDAAAQQLRCLDRTVPVPLRDGRLTLRLLVDRASLEIFADGGAVYMPMGIVFAAEDRQLQVVTDGPPASVVQLKVHALKSAWEQ
jgi:fructan beta-fructosidase